MALGLEPGGLVLEGPPGTGELRWGYAVAATLGAWGLERGVLTARVLEVHPLRVAQPGLSFVVMRPGGTPWVWPVLGLTLDGDRVTATLGPKERIH